MGQLDTAVVSVSYTIVTHKPLLRILEIPSCVNTYVQLYISSVKMIASETSLMDLRASMLRL